ncbi:hypothetical protein F2P81_016729 [Scophthalmus maximus]|uniref:Uncharacterized protein n=1 Tax=Scophthalmus maximus TaxID=52904 RepID=A0A6A4SCJ9_SCOMX|nr:hypothetical protein F2P81_016729 [Scophthalmus maximus]
MLGHTELNQLDVLRIVRRGSPTESEKGLIIPSVKSPSLEEISVEHKTRSDKLQRIYSNIYITAVANNSNLPATTANTVIGNNSKPAKPTYPIHSCQRIDTLADIERDYVTQVCMFSMPEEVFYLDEG